MITKLSEFFGEEFEEGSWHDCFDDGIKWLERRKSQPPVTVVIPVYNAFASVYRLLNAITNVHSIDSIILVDDHSFDPEVSELCSKWAQKELNRMYIRNSCNLGFVKSVNIGIKTAPKENDIILLNSDTIPSSQSIQRLKNAACSWSNIATVTPLSNAAGIFSIPNPKEYNNLPADWQVDQFADLLKLVCGAPYEIIPSGSGFCLYINRKALEKLGLLDELLFERGYAEDTDFCRRAANHGFLNIVDMSTFVYHEREGSFRSEKFKLKERNSKILKAIDTKFLSETQAWENKTRLQKLWNVLPNITSCAEIPKKTLIDLIEAKTIIKAGNKSSKPTMGYFENGEKCIALWPYKESLQIDFFGIKKVQLTNKNYSLSDIIEYLQIKWQPDSLSDANCIVSNCNTQSKIKDFNTHFFRQKTNSKTKKLDYLDLGCKKGGSFEFCKKVLGGTTGIGIDLNIDYVCQFKNEVAEAIVGNIIELPIKSKSVKFVNISHVLEHLPDWESVEKVILESCRVANDFVFIKGPYFDADEYLSKYSLKFFWSDATWHKTHIKTSQLSKFLRHNKIKFSIYGKKQIVDSSHHTILPISAPQNQLKYETYRHGKKNFIKFDRDLFQEMICIITLNPITTATH